MASDLRTALAQRLKAVLKLLLNTSSGVARGNAYVSLLQISTFMYGSPNPSAEALATIWAEKRLTFDDLSLHLQGVASAMIQDLEMGLVGSLEARYQAEVFGDFATLAKAALGEDKKDVAAVIASAAFEDAVKRYADMNGLAPGDSLQETVNALKGKGLIGGAQKGVVDSFVKLRNAAMHADWAKIHPEEVRSLIAFVEPFLMTRFEQGAAAAPAPAAAAPEKAE